MSLTNEQFESVKKILDKRRMDNLAEMDRRRNYVNSNIEGYSELSAEIAALSMNRAKALLSGNITSEDEYGAAMEKIINKKKALLVKASLPADYLDPIYDCPDCQDTGYIGAEKCHCLKNMMISTLYNRSNISDYLKTVDFSMVSDKYYSGDDLVSFKDTYKKAINFIDNFDYDFKNLLIYGTVGSGKSLISACIAKRLIEKGYSVIYFSATSLMDLFSKYKFDYKSGEDITSVYADIFQCDLLIIDDLGTELINNFSTSNLFTCLNERQLGRKATIISTNFSPKSIAEAYDDRIYSRITGNFTLCKLIGPDIRYMQKVNK